MPHFQDPDRDEANRSDEESRIDEALEETFPASDPISPSWPDPAV